MALQKYWAGCHRDVVDAPPVLSEISRMSPKELYIYASSQTLCFKTNQNKIIRVPNLCWLEVVRAAISLKEYYTAGSIPKHDNTTIDYRISRLVVGRKLEKIPPILGNLCFANKEVQK